MEIVARRERARVESALSDPGRVLEDAFESSHELLAIECVHASDRHAAAVRHTTHPSNRTSRTLTGLAHRDVSRERDAAVHYKDTGGGPPMPMHQRLDGRRQRGGEAR